MVDVRIAILARYATNCNSAVSFCFVFKKAAATKSCEFVDQDIIQIVPSFEYKLMMTALAHVSFTSFLLHSQRHDLGEESTPFYAG